MKTKLVLVVGALVVVVLLGAVLLTGLGVLGGVATSSAGRTVNAGDTATIVMVPSSASATSTSIQNTDGKDRAIESTVVACSGLSTADTAVSALVLKAATSSTAAPATITNTNLVLSTQVATSSSDLFVASTTPGSTAAAANRIWAAGSYLSFSLNATSTATCTLGVHFVRL